jgi:hypothetical protein
MKFRATPDVPWARQNYAASQMKGGINGLAKGMMAIGLAVAVFLALTTSVQFWLAAGSTSETSAGAHTYPHPSYAYVTPDPRP